MQQNRAKKGNGSAITSSEGANWQGMLIALISESLFAKIIVALIVVYYVAAAIGPMIADVETEWHGWFPTMRLKQDPTKCLWISGNSTGNDCDFDVVATQLEVMQGGIIQHIPCMGSLCRIPARANGPLVSPPEMTIIRVIAAKRGTS